MNCNNIRKYFHAFLDGELDVEKNIEVLTHLDMCCECSTKIERERSLQKRVKETVCMVKAPDYLKQTILKKVERKPGILTLFRENFLIKRRLIPLAGIATVLALIVSFFVVQSNLKKDDALHIAESTYHDYLMKQINPDIRSQDAESIVEYLRAQTGLNVTLPGIKENVRLVGAALAEINEAKVPMVFYMHDDTPIALFINCNSGSKSRYGTDIDCSKMKEEMVGRMVMYTDTGHCGSCRIVSWKKAGSQYVMVSVLNSDKIIKLLKKV